MLDFSGKANTSIHGLREDDMARLNAVLMLAHRLQRWASINTALAYCLMFTGLYASHIPGSLNN